MEQNLWGRSFLKLQDFTPDEITYLIDLSEELKQKKRHTELHARSLEGKNIALLFEKASTRTRAAFTVACVDEGAHPEYLGKDEIQFGKKESVRDTARVLGRIFDGIEFRGYRHEVAEELARYAGVPVWNGLTDKYHPTQVLADFLTLKEHLGYLRGVRLAYVGDGRNNVANTLLIGAAMLGLDFRVATPEPLLPDPDIVDEARAIARTTGATLTLTSDPVHAVEGVDAIYTDVWVSMGEDALFEERIRLLKRYQVNRALLDATGNPEVLFMHCLPAFHDLNTDVGRAVFEEFGLTAMEVTDDVFESRHSIVFDQAENRMHSIKAVMVATLSYPLPNELPLFDERTDAPQVVQ